MDIIAKKVGRALEIRREEGLVTMFGMTRDYLVGQISLISPRALYFDHVRPRTGISQDRTVCLNGVDYHPHRRFDRWLPWDPAPDDTDGFESGAIDALERWVEAGDDIVVIGGGKGVTATVAARRTGSGGSVVVYEGAADMADLVRDTVALNGVDDRIIANHAVVEVAERLDGPLAGADSVTADELPECDVLEMDCEGAELRVLERMTITPRVLIVETHGNRDAVREALNELGYQIASEQPAESRFSAERIQSSELYTVVGRHSS